jgi:4-phospho-D-threonate 3-dehydrogenase / 4-phospho-D-erythronate 3-dehydrogenase
MSQMNKPLLAITMGDPAGIGPEIIVKAWQDPQLHQLARLVVIGDSNFLQSQATALGSNVSVRPIAQIQGNESSTTGEMIVEDVSLSGTNDAVSMSAKTMGHSRINSLAIANGVRIGQPSSASGALALISIERAAKRSLDKVVDGMVTTPISKYAIHLAGCEFPGHTELLAAQCGVEQFAMMLYLGRKSVPRCRYGLSVAHVTLHMALRNVFDLITKSRIVETTELLHWFMSVMQRHYDSCSHRQDSLVESDGAESVSTLGIDQPSAEVRIGVCALNPHAGEDGLFGREEIEFIHPAVQELQSKKISAAGPFPADTLMRRASLGEFDGIVAMYHDQGHIAFKLLDMHQAVNVTLGLPIVRTSVAHGTAYDIAGKGLADPTSLKEAIRVAVALAAKKH